MWYMKRFLIPTSKFYMYTHPIITSLGVAAFFTGLVFLAAPDLALSASSLGQFLPDSYEWLWPLVHGTGGGLVVYGMARAKPNYEAAGVTLLFFTLSTVCGAVLLIRGFESGFVASSIVGSIGIGCALRAIMLVRMGSRD